MDGTNQAELGAELKRVEESAMYSAQSQFEQAKIWRGTNLVIGGPAAVLAAISGGAGLADAGNRTLAAVLALVAAGLGAIVTTLNAAGRADRAHSSANTYLAIQTDARQLRNIDLPAMEPEAARQALADLTSRQQEANVSADIPARIAYRLAKRNIEKTGGQTYAVDK